MRKICKICGGSFFMDMYYLDVCKDCAKLEVFEPEAVRVVEDNTIRSTKGLIYHLKNWHMDNLEESEEANYTQIFKTSITPPDLVKEVEKDLYDAIGVPKKLLKKPSLFNK